MFSACDEAERLGVGFTAVDIVVGSLFFQVDIDLGRGDFLNGHALGFGSGGMWLGLGLGLMPRGGRREEAGEESGHAAAESWYTGTQYAHIQFDIAPECG